MTEELSITLGNCLPTLLEFGTDAQRRRHVPRILAGQEVWCQLFSEPGAGSDLAGVQTRAVPRAGRLAGQRPEGLDDARPSRRLRHPAGPHRSRRAKHDGLSMFIVDLRAPAWRSARSASSTVRCTSTRSSSPTCSCRRSGAAAGRSGLAHRVGDAAPPARRRAAGQRGGVRHDRTDRPPRRVPGGAVTDPVVRDELVRLYIAEVCQSLLVTRSVGRRDDGADPGPVGSLGKLANALVARQFADLAWRIVGADALAWDGPALGSRRRSIPAREWAADALFTLSLSIAGGTNEIQRSIIAERVLGLPHGTRRRCGPMPDGRPSPAKPSRPPVRSG